MNDTAKKGLVTDGQAELAYSILANEVLAPTTALATAAGTVLLDYLAQRFDDQGFLYGTSSDPG